MFEIWCVAELVDATRFGAEVRTSRNQSSGVTPTRTGQRPGGATSWSLGRVSDTLCDESLPVGTIISRRPRREA